MRAYRLCLLICIKSAIVVVVCGCRHISDALDESPGQLPFDSDWVGIMRDLRSLLDVCRSFMLCWPSWGGCSASGPSASWGGTSLSQWASSKTISAPLLYSLVNVCSQRTFVDSSTQPHRLLSDAQACADRSISLGTPPRLQRSIVIWLWPMGVLRATPPVSTLVGVVCRTPGRPWW